ncbi:TetR family transcriptional regulator [Solihabitans fulvus]|uniref:TetR family transcriptional regulator n=1 Tax=Solihabitans fulvus TaxID=1892852 RepID=A0A5B2XDB0_9PSEU|nr:TetR family transcriptional regulator [Solihabitans fulvus]KAA2261323.1 TetR family transcriptional regulator [Solihabitans fulvus]
MVGLRERKKARTRSAIQQHALRLFLDQGYAATTIDQIAEAAEISQSTFFRYFPTKEDLVLHDDYDQLIFEAMVAQPKDVRPIQALRNAIRAVYEESPPDELELARQALVMSVPELRSALLNQFTELIRMVSEVLAERLGRRPDELEVRTMAGALMGVALSTMIVAAERPGEDLLALFDASLAQLDAGLPL